MTLSLLVHLMINVGKTKWTGTKRKERRAREPCTGRPDTFRITEHCDPVLIHPPQPLFMLFPAYLPAPLHLFESYPPKSGLDIIHSENPPQVGAEREEALNLRSNGI